MRIHASNLIHALLVAIKAQEKIEADQGYTQPSALLQGWKDLLRAIQNMETIEIR